MNGWKAGSLGPGSSILQFFCVHTCHSTLGTIMTDGTELKKKEITMSSSAEVVFSVNKWRHLWQRSNDIPQQFLLDGREL